MSRLKPIEVGQVGGQLQRVLASSHVSFEEVPNFLKLLAKSNAVLKAYVQSDEALLKGRLTPRQREQIALAVAEINGSNYCLVAHTAASQDAGLSNEDIRLARKAAASDPKSWAMLRFTQLMVLQRGEISDEDLRAVRDAGFSEVEVIEIIANIALNIFSNYLNMVSQTETDFPSPRAALERKSEAARMPGGDETSKQKSWTPSHPSGENSCENRASSHEYTSDQRRIQQS
jgi:uncharacterized peroxidase-related enzyme